MNQIQRLHSLVNFSIQLELQELLGFLWSAEVFCMDSPALIGILQGRDHYLFLDGAIRTEGG